MSMLQYKLLIVAVSPASRTAVTGVGPLPLATLVSCATGHIVRARGARAPVPRARGVYYLLFDSVISTARLSKWAKDSADAEAAVVD